MRVLTTVAELQALADAERAAGRRLALVPTMGALHAGHLSLVAEGRRRADRVWLSIFVNPTQFEDARDLAAYPRTLEADLALCREAGVDLVFAPAAAEMRTQGAQTWVEVTELAKPLVRPLAPGALPRRRDGGDAAPAGRQAARRRLRREGLPAARGDPPAGAGPALRRRDRGRSDPARAGRAGDVEPQPPPRPRGAPPGARALAGARAKPSARSRPASGAPRGCSRSSRPRSARLRAPASTTPSCAIRTRWSRRPPCSTGPTLLALAVRFEPVAGGEGVRLIDNRVLQPQRPLEDPPCSEPC